MLDFGAITRNEKREGYRELCGTPHRLGDGKGGSRLVRFFCHQDECETCQQIKGSSYKYRLLGMIGAGVDVVKLEVNQAVSEVLRKGLDKDEYLCLPQADGTDILFIDSSRSESKTIVLDEKDLDEEDWGKITRRVDGRKISGGFGRPAKKVKEERDGGYDVEDTAYLFGNHKLAVEVLHDVVKSTYRVVVETPDAMQELVTNRNELFEKMYKERGGVIISRFHKVVHVWGLDVNNSIIDNIEDSKSQNQTSDLNRKSFAEDQPEIPWLKHDPVEGVAVLD